MASKDDSGEIIKIDCVCGQELKLSPDLLGRIFPCPYCGRYLRPGLQFVMINKESAPNLTAVCTCGRFVVAGPTKTGKKVKCQMCGRRVVLPEPVGKHRGHLYRISSRVLEKQLRRVRSRQEGRKGASRSRSRAARRGRFSLKPGQKVCPNPECRMPLPQGANICPSCALNIRTGERYQPEGPGEDPVGSWQLEWVQQ
ncbi:MAG: hypothetical protein ACOCSQ_00190 [Planctomycetota bacterium]